MRHEDENKREATTTEEERLIEALTETKAATQQRESLSRKGKRAAQSLRQASRGKKLLIALATLWATGMVGLAIGYSVVGDGSFVDAFKPGTYKHMYDLVFKTNS